MTKNILSLFDLDGVLLDSDSNLSWLKESIKKTLIYFKIPPTDDNLKTIHFKNIEQFKKCCMNFGIDPEVIWPIRNGFYIDEKMNAMKSGEIKPFSDVVEIYKIRRFSELGIISNSPQIIVDEFVTYFNFSDLFTINIGRGNTYWDIKHLKPSPYLFSKVKNKNDFNHFYYIGNMESDREFALNTNMKYLHLDRGENHPGSSTNLSELIVKLENHFKDNNFI